MIDNKELYKIYNADCYYHAKCIEYCVSCNEIVYPDYEFDDDCYLSKIYKYCGGRYLCGYCEGDLSDYAECWECGLYDQLYLCSRCHRPLCSDCSDHQSKCRR